MSGIIEYKRIITIDLLITTFNNERLKELEYVQNNETRSTRNET